jgi:hypothetical protein
MASEPRGQSQIKCVFLEPKKLTKHELQMVFCIEAATLLRPRGKLPMATRHIRGDATTFVVAAIKKKYFSHLTWLYQPREKFIYVLCRI